jgi:hypothetical protein
LQRNFPATQRRRAPPGDKHRPANALTSRPDLPGPTCARRNPPAPIVDHPDELLNAGRLAQCNEIVRQADIQKRSAPLLITFLGITRVSTHRLAERAEFCARARAKRTAQIGAERAESLLDAYT